MRVSVELALNRLARHLPADRVLLTPGDSPGITPDLVAFLLETAARRPDCIVVPCYHGRRGHPIVLPWDMAAEIPALPANLGVNALIARHPDRLVEQPVSNPDVVADLDTPEDLHHWNERQFDRDCGERPCRS